jgi:hypothetical protein
MNGANTYPQICSEVGLTCESCTSTTARQLAAICKGLRGKAVGQLFVQIYPDPACAPMHAHFAAQYREGTVESGSDVDVDVPERREVTFARSRSMYAVA